MEVQSLRHALKAAAEQREAQVTILTEQLQAEKKHMKDLWHINCAQLAEFDTTLSAKEDKVEALCRELAGAQVHRASPTEIGDVAQKLVHGPYGPQASTTAPSKRCGRAPSMDAFTGEDL